MGKKTIFDEVILPVCTMPSLKLVALELWLLHEEVKCVTLAEQTLMDRRNEVNKWIFKSFSAITRQLIALRVNDTITCVSSLVFSFFISNWVNSDLKFFQRVSFPQIQLFHERSSPQVLICCEWNQVGIDIFLERSAELIL